jgi:ankyrin repeat protein
MEEDRQSAIDSAMIQAAEIGHLGIMSALFRAGADIHAGVDLALRLAAEHGHVKAVEFLLKRGGDAHAMHDDALHLAEANGHGDVVALLREWPGFEAYQAHLKSEWDEFYAVRKDLPPMLDVQAIIDNLNANVRAELARRENHKKGDAPPRPPQQPPRP